MPARLIRTRRGERGPSRRTFNTGVQPYPAMDYIITQDGHHYWTDPRLYTTVLTYSDGEAETIQCVAYSMRTAMQMCMDARERKDDIPVGVMMHNISLKDIGKKLGGAIKYVGSKAGTGLRYVGEKIPEGIVRLERRAGISEDEIQRVFGRAATEGGFSGYRQRQQALERGGVQSVEQQQATAQRDIQTYSQAQNIQQSGQRHIRAEREAQRDVERPVFEAKGSALSKRLRQLSKPKKPTEDEDDEGSIL